MHKNRVVKFLMQEKLESLIPQFQKVGRHKLRCVAAVWSGPRILDRLPSEEGKYLAYGKAH